MYSGRIGQLTLYQQDDTAYLIIDGDAQEEAMAATSATPFLKRPATWVCETVAELEERDGPAVMSLLSSIRWLITECSVRIHGTAESTSSIVKA